MEGDIEGRYGTFKLSNSEKVDFSLVEITTIKPHMWCRNMKKGLSHIFFSSLDAVNSKPDLLSPVLG